MIEMSGFVCGYISCVFYLGSRFPQLYKNVSRFLAKYTCVFYKIICCFRCWILPNSEPSWTRKPTLLMRLPTVVKKKKWGFFQWRMVRILRKWWSLIDGRGLIGQGRGIEVFTVEFVRYEQETCFLW